MAKSNKTEKKWRTDHRISESRMSLESFASLAQGYKLTGNDLNKPKQKVWYVR